MWCVLCTVYLAYMYLREKVGEVTTHWWGLCPRTHPVYYRLRGSASGCRGVTYHRRFRSDEFLWKKWWWTTWNEASSHLSLFQRRNFSFVIILCSALPQWPHILMVLYMMLNYWTSGGRLISRIKNVSKWFVTRNWGRRLAVLNNAFHHEQKKSNDGQGKLLSGGEVGL